MDAGLIGLGKMGGGIARNLLRGGHRLTLYNRTAARAEAFRSEGAKIATSVAEACAPGLVLTMVSDDAALENLVYGNGGILASLPPGGLHISLSTISVAMSDRMAADHAKARQEYVAAPVFGRPEAAASAALIVVAAGQVTSIERAKPLFASMSSRLVELGEKPSLASVVKLCGNFLFACVIESLAETYAFARKSGVDSQVLHDFLTSAMFNSPIYKLYGSMITGDVFEPAGFETRLGFKDVKLVLQAAESIAVPMPVASVIHDRLVTAIARGYADKDWSVLGRIAAEDSGLPPIK